MREGDLCFHHSGQGVIMKETEIWLGLKCSAVHDLSGSNSPFVGDSTVVLTWLTDLVGIWHRS